jgi:hypothetical protein
MTESCLNWKPRHEGAIAGQTFFAAVEQERAAFRPERRGQSHAFDSPVKAIVHCVVNS